MIRQFTYVAVDSSGARKTGVVSAASENQARDQLAQRGLLVELVQEGKSESERSTFATQVAGPLIGKVSYEHQLTFFRQLASMHKAGVPLVQSLDTLARSTRSGKLRQVIEDMRAHVLEGKNISEAMEKYPEVFSALQVNLIRAGEQGGVLERSLAQLTDYLEREIRLRNEINSKTFYPKLLIVVSLLIIVGANFAIGYFASGSGGPAMFLESPLLNPHVLVWLVPLAVISFLFFRYGPQNPKIRRNLHQFYLAIPYFGSTIRMLAMAKFGRAFAALYSGGVPIARSVQLAADASGNEYLREQIYPAAEKIQEGRPIAESFAQTGAFTEIAIDMAATGEHTGNLDSMFDHMAQQYEDEADVRLDKSCKTLGVLILILALMIVGYSVIKFWMGYFGASGLQQAAGQ